MSLQIALIGYGKMGRAIEVEAQQRNHIITHRIDPSGPDAWEDLHAGEADVAIEFSHPETALENFSRLMKLGIPVVAGTTGWYEALDQLKKEVEERDAAFLYSSNFSPGVNMLFKLNHTLAKMMNQQPEYDVFVEERHHKYKKDGPSGTAKSLAGQLIEELDRKTHIVHGAMAHRPPEADEVSVAYTRAGEIIGWHEVTYTSEIDQLSIRHEAFNRRGFALGSVIAAEWLVGKKGFYNFVDIFE